MSATRTVRAASLSFKPLEAWTAWHVAGPLIQSCGGARRSGEAVARQVVAQLAAK
ncbi:hypothetical protein [Mesorhizobium sp. NZP2234]|uniref:hypothetical protein n=1 Tax=Mesorhizobium sp. NZP2234 TaxID=2483402 RepID=UPI0015548271|nr:hypothetical protein [Mesorhizobium sp. NZP2234]